MSGLTCLLGDVWWFYAGRSSLSLLPDSVQLTSASEVQILHAERTSIPGLRDEQREAQLAQIAAFVLLTCASFDFSSWSQLHGLPQGTSLRQCPFPSRTLGASPALQVEVFNWLVFDTCFFATLVTSSSSASRPSPLGLGGCLCIASTAHSFIYRPIYSRTRAYQTRPAVELVSGEEGLSLSRPLLARHCLRVQG